MSEGDKVVFRKLGWRHEMLGTVVGTNETVKTVAVKRFFRLYLINQNIDYIVVYRKSRRKQRKQRK